MKCVAFLQNLWVKDPTRVQAMFERYPEQREYMLRKLLFCGGRTGTILKATLGWDLCLKIIWDESTTQIAGDSKFVFPPEPAHIRRVLEKHRPEIVVTFGLIASKSVFKVFSEMMAGLGEFKCQFRSVPHPCARTRQDPLGKLHELRGMLTREGVAQ
jgi:hypothetical protein